MSIEAQAEEVDKVKRSEYGVITDPFYLSPEHTLEDANALMAKFRISGVPITEGRKLVGIITNRDLKFEEDFSRKIRDSYRYIRSNEQQGGNVFRVVAGSPEIRVAVWCRVACPMACRVAVPLEMGVSLAV